jgi:peptidoglycan/LPS O-acetylase OafA/YrhL
VERPGRLPALDGLRALAVGAVILTHTWVARFAGGWVGVDVFFVLSGFLITNLLVTEHAATGGIGLVRFYRRRAVRLLPALLVMLPLVVVLAVIFAPQLAAATLSTSLFTVGYVANWQAATHAPTGLLSHMWSLSVEEQFYVVWPLILLLLLRLANKRTALVVTLLLIAAVVLHRCLVTQGIDPHDPQLFWRTDTRADSLLVGCALALTRSLGWSGSPRLWRVGAIAGATYLVVLLPTSFNTGTWNYTVGYTVAALAAAMVIGSVAVGSWAPMTQALSWEPLERFGRISYAVYLWHFPVAVLLPIGQGPLLAIATVSIAGLLATMSWRWVEQPALRWRSSERARARRPPSLAAANAPHA